MENIVSEDGYVIGSAKHLQLLRLLAKERTELAGYTFRESDYRWRLGIAVLSDLQIKNRIYMRQEFDTVPMLFGIAVDVDYVNPDNVQLWENIVNKL